MLKFWLCFFSFFYTINNFSTEEEKVKCGICYDDSSPLIKSKEIFSCNCNENLLICKECILRLIEEEINSKKEKKLTENNKKIPILEIIFGYIKDEIKDNNDLQNFVKKIIKEVKEKKNKDIKIEEDQNLKLVYKNIYEKENGQGFYIGNEKYPTRQLKFIKSFLSLLKQFNGEDSYSSFTNNIEMFIFTNCHKEMKIEEVEKWKEKDVEIEVSCKPNITEFKKKIKNEKVISIGCPFCRRKIKKAPAFFLKEIFWELPSQESSKKLSCIKICEGLCSDCC